MSLHDIKKKLDVLRLFEKSTNAMKLMSLSLHHQIKKMTPQISAHINEVKLFVDEYFDLDYSGNKVFIFVGAERGFCGDYMDTLVKKFYFINKNNPDAFFIIIGKIFYNKIKKDAVGNVVSIVDFKLQNIDKIITSIIKTITERDIKVADFFAVKARSLSEREMYVRSVVVSVAHYHVKKNFLLGHFNSLDIVSHFFYDFFFSQLKLILLESLYAEQGARFISMDTALKNAKDIIDKNNKLYFKMRQKKINAELDDLVSNLL